MSSRRPPSTPSPSRTATGWWTIPVRRRASRQSLAGLALDAINRNGTRVRTVGPCLLLLIASICCGRATHLPDNGASVLRVGVGQIEVSQLIQNLTIEGLIAVGADGRVKPWLARDWKLTNEGRLLTIGLRPGVKFHDGSPASAAILAGILRKSIGQFAGPSADDIAEINAPAEDRIEVSLKKPSRFVLESLETPLPGAGGPNVGTGPFIAASDSERHSLHSNTNYYLGPPPISEVHVEEYPSVRSSWAEMLRDHLDMVYEVGLDELDSLQTATTINVFSAVRHYQYVVILNTKVGALRTAEVRRALNIAVDRDAIVRDGLNGHGVPSTGPIWPSHWAAQPPLPTFAYDPQQAARIISRESGGPSATGGGGYLRFTCLVASDADRISLVVKRQLQAVGVDMVLQEASRDDLNKAAATGHFDAILTGIISGPSIVRPYLWWYSRGPRNLGSYANNAVDSALDAIDGAGSDDGYRAGVEHFQAAILADPPAIFLAWDERARAVSKRFDVVKQPGADIIRTLHLWRPVAGSGKPDNN
jgi:ABC-type transport system substrate-binding protein